MKYSITPEQRDHLYKGVEKVLDKYFTPDGGWENLKEELDNTNGELFIFQKDEDFTQIQQNEYNFYTYYDCSDEYDDKDCPEIHLEEYWYDRVSNMFGENLFKEVFKEWFFHHTGYKIKDVRKS